MKPASITQRLGAIIYDLFLLVSCITFATLLLVIALNDGVSEKYMPAFRVGLILLCYIFYVWVVRGQTLGMLAWKIKITDKAKNNISVLQASVRFILSIVLTSIFAINFVWMLFDPKKQPLHEKLSNTVLVKS